MIKESGRAQIKMEAMNSCAENVCGVKRLGAADMLKAQAVELPRERRRRRDWGRFLPECND